MLKKEYEIKRYQEVVFRYKSFLNKYFIEVEEVLATKRIVLIMAFVIHSSKYLLSAYFRCSTLVTASYLNFPRVVPYSVSSDVVFQSVCITYLLFISHCRWLYRLRHHKKFKLCALINCVLLKGLIGRKQQNNFFNKL